VWHFLKIFRQDRSVEKLPNYAAVRLKLFRHIMVKQVGRIRWQIKPDAYLFINKCLVIDKWNPDTFVRNAILHVINCQIGQIIRKPININQRPSAIHSNVLFVNIVVVQHLL
jgi:hypothetical protein